MHSRNIGSYTYANNGRYLTLACSLQYAFLSLIIRLLLARQMAPNIVTQINERLAKVETITEQLAKGQDKLAECVISIERVIIQNQSLGKRVGELESDMKKNTATIQKWGGALLIIAPLASFALNRLF